MQVPPVHFLPPNSDRVDELRCWLQVRNPQPVFKYTADAAFAHGLPLMARRGGLSREGASRAHFPRLHGYAGHGDGGDLHLHARVPPDVGGMLLVTGLLRLADVPTMYMWCRGDSLSVMLHPDCTAVRERNDCDSAGLP